MYALLFPDQATKNGLCNNVTQPANMLNLLGFRVIP